MKSARSFIAVATLAAAVLAGCSSSVDVPPLRPEETASFAAAANTLDEGYLLEPGDRIRVRYTFHEELDQQLVIRPDGKIRAAEIGEVVAAGRTPKELSAELEKLSSVRLRDPAVLVSITEYAPRTIYVAGEVGRPGTIPYRRGLTPLQAVTEAGGFADTAKLDKVVLVRAVGTDGRTLTRTLDIEDSMKHGVPEPIFLAPHDVLYVPRTGVAEANIWVDQHVTRLFPFFRGAGGKMDVGQQ